MYGIYRELKSEPKEISKEKFDEYVNDLKDSESPIYDLTKVKMLKPLSKMSPENANEVASDEMIDRFEANDGKYYEPTTAKIIMRI